MSDAPPLPEAPDETPSHAATRPVVRLRPDRRRRGLGPWAYADEVVLDRRTRAVPAGSVVTVEDAERRPVATAAFNASSKIALRWLDADPAAVIDAGWFEARLARALGLRETLFDAPFYRLVHAEADGLPGVVIDRFGEAAVVQPNAAWADARLGEIVQALVAVTGIATVVKNAGGRARSLEGLDGESTVLVGALDGPVAVPMNGATYLADLAGGQKTGLFYDQRPNHAFAARLARGRDVLDVFAHVGGFGLAALAAGATSALAVDGSVPALELAAQGAAASGVAERFGTMKADAFDAMAALGAEGRRFGVVVCDPPAFAPAKAAVDAGLRAYERVARLGAGLTGTDGFLVLCSCSHAVDLAKFREASLRGVAKAGRRAQVLRIGGAGPDHPVHADLTETSYLKALFLRLD
jgi:23S rRNA (cytosine1962-C5)-methyltransferase